MVPLYFTEVSSLLKILISIFIELHCLDPSVSDRDHERLAAAFLMNAAPTFFYLYYKFCLELLWHTLFYKRFSYIVAVDKRSKCWTKTPLWHIWYPQFILPWSSNSLIVGLQCYYPLLKRWRLHSDSFVLNNHDHPFHDYVNRVNI